MRYLTDHVVNPANEQIRITVLDEPGSGGANHQYQVSWGIQWQKQSMVVSFQNGPIDEVGVNGVTQEVLLAICIDRLRGFQNGPFACRENALALTKLEEAQMWLLSRTRARIARGVEGTHSI